MLRKVVVALLAVMFFVGSAYALENFVDNRITSGTVSFSTTAYVVTFSSVTNRIMLRNLSAIDNCYVDVIGKDVNGIRGGYATRNFASASTAVLVPAGGPFASAPTVELTFATQNLIVSGSTTAKEGSLLNYVVTGNKETL